MTETAKIALPDLFDGLDAWKAHLEDLRAMPASAPGHETMVRHAEHTIRMLTPEPGRPSAFGPVALKDWRAYLDELKALPDDDPSKTVLIDEVEETIEALVDLAEEDEGGDIDG